MEKAHKNLKAWQEAMHLAKVVYEATTKFPNEEKYGLTNQMRRASVSIPSNIAEGCARQSRKEAIQFFVIARGSLSELDTQLELSRDLTFIDSSNYSLLSSHLNQVDKLLSGLIRYNRSSVKAS